MFLAFLGSKAIMNVAFPPAKKPRHQAILKPPLLQKGGFFCFERAPFKNLTHVIYTRFVSISKKLLSLYSIIYLQMRFKCILQNAGKVDMGIFCQII